jgi:hypothetical protein
MTKKKTDPVPEEVPAEPVPEQAPVEQAPEETPAEEAPQEPQAAEPQYGKSDEVVVRCEVEQALLQGKMMRKGWRKTVPYSIYEQAARATPGAFALVPAKAVEVRDGRK